MAGFSFGTLNKTPASTGFSFGGSTQAGGSTTAQAGTGFSFGGGLGLGGQQKTTGGLTLGTATTTTSSSGFSYGGGLASGGFKLGGGTTTTTAGGLGGGLQLGGTTTTTSTTGTTFGGFGSTTTASTGLTLGGATTSSTGFSFGGGLGGTATTKSGLTLGGIGTTATSGGLSLGGAGSIFSTPATTASKGLGGIDPKTVTSTSGLATTTGKPSDSKAIKETALPADICTDVENFKKHLKAEKGEREEIARVSHKSLVKVQEDVGSLKQLLAVVSNSLQRNAVAIDKLKAESALELKYAEVAQRTKDTPPGLQYENTAPTEYFQRLVEDFEVRMHMYRQQIEELESHIASLSQPSMLSPQELSMLFNKVHDSFVALAAQLQLVHEAVKTQKEHYLNYRRVFHGDTTDIFERRRKVTEKTGSRPVVPVTTVGPTPFSGLPNATAQAMASAVNRTNTAGAPTLGLNTSQQPSGLGTSLLGGSSLGGTSSIFGAPTTTSTSAFGGLTGGSVFGAPAKTTQTVTPFNFGTGTGASTAGGSLFRSATTTTPAPQLGTPFGTPATAGVPGGNTTTPVAGTEVNQPFQLQKPPSGNKRGKRT